MTIQEQILKLRDEGKSYREIQKIVGCSKGTIAYHCGPGQKIKSLSRQNERRNKGRQFIQEYKTKNSVCADCKESYPYWMLDFDHLKDKSFTICDQKTLSVDRLKKEIKKCEVVCANCHRNRTYTRSLTDGCSISKDLITTKWDQQNAPTK